MPFAGHGGSSPPSDTRESLSLSRSETQGIFFSVHDLPAVLASLLLTDTAAAGTEQLRPAPAALPLFATLVAEAGPATSEDEAAADRTS